MDTQEHRAALPSEDIAQHDLCVRSCVSIGAHHDDNNFHCGSEVHVHFATPGNMFDRLISSGVSGHLFEQDEVLFLDGE